MGARDQAEGHAARDAAVAHRPQHRRVPRRSVAERRRDRHHRRAGSTAARPQGKPADAPPPRDVRRQLDEWTYGEPDLDRPHGEGLQDSRRTAPTSFPKKSSIPSITEDRYVKWVQIIPDAHACRAPLARLCRSARRHRHRRPRPRHGLERRQRDGPDRIRRRQRRRHLPGRHGEDPEEGIDVPLRGALPSLRRGDVRPAARRHQVLSEGRTCPSTSSPRTASAPASATTGC